MSLWHYTVDLDWSGPGSPGVNVWDIRNEGTLADEEVQSAVSAIQAFYTTLAGGSILASPYTATGRDEAVEITTREVLPVTGFTTSTGVSDNAFSGLTQMILTLRTSSATRRGRGRKFIGPVSSACMGTDGTPTPAAVTQLQDAANTLLAASGGVNGWGLGVYSSVDGLFRDVTVMQARNYFVGLRSRRD